MHQFPLIDILNGFFAVMQLGYAAKTEYYSICCSEVNLKLIYHCRVEVDT